MIELHKIGTVTENTENWYIVRKLGDEIYSQNFIHVPELSPSPELFARYRQLKKLGQWNKETFDNIYVPIFLKEMTSEQAINHIKFLVRESKKRNIALFCFCENEIICHRSIVGGILKGYKSDIICPDEYLKYYEMYINILDN